MANLKGINPGNSGMQTRAPSKRMFIGSTAIRRLNERPGTAEAEMPRPEDRKPEAWPPGEPHGRQVAANAPAPRKSMRRPLMFALLPVALVVGGYFYVTGGA